MRHMKRAQPVAISFEKLRQEKKTVAVAAIVLVAAVLVAGRMGWQKGRAEVVGPAPQGAGIFSRFQVAARNIQKTVEEIRRLDIENQRLRLENAQLRQQLETAVFEGGLERSRRLTAEHAAKAEKVSGSRVGRTPASLAYRPPAHLLPQQLQALGLAQLRGKEYEKAAKIFTQLSELPREEGYRSPGHLLVTGVTWYRLKNWDIAESYFDSVLAQEKTSKSESELKLFAQARLWKALVAQQRGERARAQARLVELVDHHPRSPEAGWINRRVPTGGRHGRVPASKH